MALPLYLTASFMTKQPGAGIPGAPSVFNALNAPPASGVAAETAANNAAHAKGISVPNSQALLDRTRNRDHLRDFYDTASILRVQA